MKHTNHSASMITYHITRFVHSVIRANKLMHIVDTLLEKSHRNETLLDDLIAQFKRFLRKGSEEIFERNRLKYVTYLDDFKTHLSDIKDFGKHKDIQINSLLLEIYEIPKKRNNLLSAFLVYFYLRNHRHLQGKTVFKIIYLYFLIITYRNRLGDSVRVNILKMDSKNLRPAASVINNVFRRLQKRYRLPSLQSFRTMGVVLAVTVLGLVSWKYGLTVSGLQADASAAMQGAGPGNGFILGKVAMDSILLGRLTDGVNSTLQGFGLQNILILALLAVIFQSLRTGFTNLFVNSLLVKTFQAIGTVLKIVFHAVFAVYNYVIYKLATRYIFASVDFIVSRSILPGRALMSLFLLGYFSIHILIITAYFFLIALFFVWNPVWWHIAMIVLGLSCLLISVNLHADVANFRSFLMEIDSIFKSVREENEKKGSTEWAA